MRLLSLGPVLGISFGSAVVLFVASVIGSETRIGKPEWTRTCHTQLTGKERSVAFVCGDYVHAVLVSDWYGVSEVKAKPITCRAYRTRGLFSKIDLDCGT